MSPSTAIQILAVLSLSLPAIAIALWVRLSKGRFLPYERRWPVPWGAVGGVIAFALVILAVLSVVAEPASMEQAAASAGQEVDAYLWDAFISSAVFLALVGFIALALSSALGATRGDLGLPEHIGQFLKDARLGLLAGLASLVPVYGVQLLLVNVLGLGSEHPTLTNLMENLNPQMMLIALFTAVIAAPIFEEVVFRLLLQGWLERMEDEALGVANRLKFDSTEEENPPPHETLDQLEATIDNGENPYASPMTAPLRKLLDRKGNPPEPPAETLAGLPHGWGPVLLSSFLFCFVHISQGAACISLFSLALVLGYLYQRTHRILPSVIAHMTFNLVSLTLAVFESWSN